MSNVFRKPREWSGHLQVAARIEKAVRTWPHWSPAERRRMDEIVGEITQHCRSDTGNAFIRGWCDNNLKGVV